MYHLFSLRLSSWMFANGTYGSDIKQAKKVDHEEMLALCIRHYQPIDNSFGLIPILIETLEEIASAQR